MMSRFTSPALLGGLALAGLLCGPALAQAPAAPTPDKGDTAWMLVATCLVLMMSVPGLALFYGGLVRTKNMLSVLTQVFAIVCLVCLIWVTYGYSLAFTNGGGLNDFVGGFSKAFLAGVDATTTAATFSNGVVIPELVYVCFQMTFAMITPALIVGAFAERMKFSALVLFMVLWVTFIYFPMAHMVWYWGGPDVVAEAAPRPRRGRRRRRQGRGANPARRGHGGCRPHLPVGRRSTSPAAPSCTSMPASPVWSAA